MSAARFIREARQNERAEKPPPFGDGSLCQRSPSSATTIEASLGCTRHPKPRRYFVPHGRLASRTRKKPMGPPVIVRGVPSRAELAHQASARVFRFLNSHRGVPQHSSAVSS